MEVLAAYSQSAQAADLQLGHPVALTGPVCVPKPGEATNDDEVPDAGAGSLVPAGRRR